MLQPQFKTIVLNSENETMAIIQAARGKPWILNKRDVFLLSRNQQLLLSLHFQLMEQYFNSYIIATNYYIFPVKISQGVSITVHSGYMNLLPN